MRFRPLLCFLLALLVPLASEATITVNISVGPCSHAGTQSVLFGIGTHCASFPGSVGSVPQNGGSIQFTTGDGQAPAQISIFCGSGTCNGSCAETPPTVAGGTYSVSVGYSGACLGVVTPPNYCWGGSFTNNTAYPLRVQLVTSPGYFTIGCCDVPAMSVGCSQTLCTTNGPFSAGWTTSGGTCANPNNPFTIYPPTQAYTNNDGSSSSTTPGGTGQGNGAPGAPPGSTNGPVWTPGSGTGTNLATSQDIQNLSGTVAAGLGQIGQKLDTANQHLGEADVGIDTATNLLGQINAQQGNGTNYLNEIATNSLAQGFWSKLGSNAWYAGGSPTSVSNMAWGGVTSGMTNFSTATNSGVTQLGGTPAAIDTTTSSFGSGPSIGSGSSTGLSFSFCGYTLNLDPENWCPGISAYIKAAWTVVLLAWFAYSAGTLLMDCAKTFASAQTGGVPDMAAEIAGFGGNLVGLAVAAIVPIVVIAIWKLVFDWYLGSAISTYLGQVGAGINGGFGYNGNQIALYLLNQTFPISLFFGVVITRLAMQFTAAKLIIVASACSRFVMGR